MPAVERCIFCDVSLDPSHKNLPSSRSKEHVFARWYRNGVVNDKLKMFTADMNNNVEFKRQPPLEQLVNANVCRACNGGWMEQLETAVDPLIQRLAEKGDIESFSPQEVEILARWTGKTAVVLSYVTPEKNPVPQIAAHSLHPDSPVRPSLRFFYASIKSDFTLEGGFLQLVYGSELGLINTNEVPATRMTICVYNRMLTVDFPPIVQGLFYDLSQSISAMFWPNHQAAGNRELGVTLPAPISQVLLKICNGIQVGFREAAFRP
jgi:hypothetical protein